MTHAEFLQLRSLITVAHHIPGRIRLKFSASILGHPAVSSLASLAKDKGVHDSLKDKGFIKATPNLFARSLVLEYDPARIAPQVLDTFFGGKDVEEATRLAEQVAELLNIDLQP